MINSASKISGEKKKVLSSQASEIQFQTELGYFIPFGLDFY